MTEVCTVLTVCATTSEAVNPNGVALRAAAFLALLALTIPAVAKQPPAQVLQTDQATAGCGPVSDVTSYLADRFGEHVTWWGRAAGHVTMVITERADARTWTLLAVHDGLACMVSSGGTREGVGA